MENAPPLWRQWPTENALWFGRFTSFLQQEKPRSAVAVYRAACERKGTERHGKKRLALIDCLPASWAAAKVKYHWQERVDLWDAAEHARQERAWAAARRAERREELAIAVTLRAKGYALLALPILAEVVKHNRKGEETDWLLVPEFRAFNAAMHLFVVAMTHARTALEMPLRYDQAERTGREGGPLAGGTKEVGMTQTERLARLRDLVQVAALRRSREADNTPRGTATKVEGVR